MLRKQEQMHWKLPCVRRKVYHDLPHLCAKKRKILETATFLLRGDESFFTKYVTYYAIAEIDTVVLRYVQPTNIVFSKQTMQSTNFSRLSTHTTRTLSRTCLSKESTRSSATAYATAGQQTHRPTWRTLRSRRNLSRPFQSVSGTLQSAITWKFSRQSCTHVSHRMSPTCFKRKQEDNVNPYLKRSVLLILSIRAD